MEELRKLFLDARTEWAVRWTVLLGIGYAFYFFPPSSSPSWIDWSLPVQLISGGNMGFYNAGFHIWFGVGAAVAMVVAGCFLSAIYPLLRQDDLVAAYFALMGMLTVSVLPVIIYIGVLNNLTSIAVLLIIIFTEVFYGPILNLRSLLPDAKAIFTEVIRGNAVPAIIYVGFSLAVYAIPPWHSGLYQSFSLVSSVLAGIDQVLSNAADKINSLTSDNPDNNAECQKFLRQLSQGLFQETNGAGLEIPVTLYGDQGLYEFSVLYPLTSLQRKQPANLGKSLDETSFHVALVLWTLGSTELVSAMADDALLRQAVVEYLRASASLARAVSAVIQIPRRSWSQSSADWRQEIATNLKLFGSAGTAPGTLTTKEQGTMEQENCRVAAENLRDIATGKDSTFQGALLWATVRDLAFGDREIVHQSVQVDKKTGGDGSLGRIFAVTSKLQSSWSNKFGPVQQVFRMGFLEQMLTLFMSWLRGWAKAVQTLNWNGTSSVVKQQPFFQRRSVRRSCQFIVGTWGLYAMATWWDSYRTLLGSSSTGQWTMVAFYVCFRATCEETVNASILRAIGHLLGALLSWGMNTAATTNGARMGTHLALNLVVSWFVPPPFVYPSKIQFSFDTWLGEGLLEGLLTTYHLTSVLVLSTDIESAAKARALSQCIGAAAASVVSLLVLPLFARQEAKRTLDSFSEQSRQSIEKLGEETDTLLSATMHHYVDELLQARRDLSGAVDSKSWLISLLRSVNMKPANTEDTALTEQLTRASVGGYALEALLRHVEILSAGGHSETAKLLREHLSQGNYDDSLSILREAILVAKDSTKDELATVYILVLMIRECKPVSSESD